MGEPFRTLLVRHANGVAWITLNRPLEANALSLELAEEFHTAIQRAEADPQVCALVLRGSGRFFCAGGDVIGMAAAADHRAFISALAQGMHRVILALAHSRLVVVAAVNGPAAGAGLGLVLSADIVLASSGASFLSGYSGVGLTPDCGVSYALPRAIGRTRAAQILLAGQSVSAETAAAWGFVTELVDEDKLDERAEALAEALAGSARQTLGPTKRLLSAEFLSGLEGHLAAEHTSIVAAMGDPDTVARVLAFAERSRRR
ncbi:enoyl-CoA hydratase-related protein [soil metagenome]